MHLSIFAAFEWVGWLINPTNWPTVLAVAAGLGFVIFVHELGHFLVAKACGVKCEKFYLGFDIYGLKLFKFQWGETEYGIGILPLGGYVKMLGQDDNPARMAEETQRAKLKAEQAAANVGKTSTADSSLATAEHAPPLTHGDLPPEPVSDPHTPYDPRSYMAQSVPKRMAIISAGVIMNVIFAFLMASLAYALGVKETPCIVQSVASGGAAWQAELQTGDVVTKIGEVENPRFRDLQTGVTLGDVEEGIPFVIERAGKQFELTLYPDSSLGVPMIGINGPAMPVLDDPPAAKHSPAGRAEPKFRAGDRIVQVGDTPVEAAIDIERALASHLDQPLQVTVERAAKDDAKQAAGDPADKPERIEIAVAPTPVRDFGMVMTMKPISSVQRNSPAERAGIKPGDELISLNGQPVGNPLTLPERMRKAAIAGETVALTVRRRNESGSPATLDVDIQPRTAAESTFLLPISPLDVPSLGIAYPVVPVIKEVLPGSPAAEARIKPGDEIVAAQVLAVEKPAVEKPNGEEQDAAAEKASDDEDKLDQKDGSVIKFSRDPAWPYVIFRYLPFVHPERKVRLWVKSGDEEREVDLLPVEFKSETGAPLYVPERGFSFKPLHTIHTARNLGEAIRLGGEETIDNLLLVYRFLQRLGQGQISPKMAAGPVGIAQMAGAKVREGFSSFLLFLTMLSANLAVINFLPIPVLDGGHMVFLLYEGIRRKPASEGVIIAFTYAGLLFLLTLMLFVLSLDLGWISRR